MRDIDQSAVAGLVADLASKAADSAVVKLTGDQTVAGTKTFSSTISGNISGNAGTATALATARTINGVSFDGTANITITAGAAPDDADGIIAQQVFG